MKKRILSLLLVVAMLAAMVVVPAYAAAPNAADYNNTPDTCPCCGKAWSAISWTDIPAATNVTSSYNIDAGGHYRLVGDRQYGYNASHAIRARGNTDKNPVVFDFNGYNITAAGTLGTERIFTVISGNTLHIVDTSSGSTGTAVSSVTGGNPVYNAGTLNIYAGHFSVTTTTATNGGIVHNVGTAMNIKGGVFDASLQDKATGRGGAVYSATAITIEDAYIIGGNAGYGGNAVYGNATTINIQGGAVIEGSVYSLGGNINLSGSPVLTELDLTGTNYNSYGAGDTAVNSCQALTGGSITVKAAADTPFTAAGANAAYFKSGVSGLIVDVDADNKLILTTPPTAEGVCPHCGVAATWEPWTAAVNTTLSAGGHYYLYEDQQISDNYIIGANICLDMNGYDISGTSNSNQLFWVNSTATLNICDVSDSGKSELKAYGNCAGGVAYISGNLNIKGGTNGISLSSTAPTPGDGTPDNPGGLLRIAGNSSVVKVEGCTLTGSDYAHTNGGVLYNGGSNAKITFTDCAINGSHVSGNGGAISTATGTITLNGCTVTGGTADGYGGAIAFTGNGKLNLKDTTVTDGTAAAIDGFSTAGIYHASYGGNTIEASTVGTIYTVNNGAWITLIGTVTIGNLILDNDTQSTINAKTNTESMSTDSSIGLTVTADKFGGYGKVSTAGENAEAKKACFTLTNTDLALVARDLDVRVEYPGVAAVDAEGYKTWFATADEALAQNPEYLLLGAVSAVEVNSDAIIDVNGNDVTITGSGSVTCFDSANANYISFGEVTLEGVTLANTASFAAPDGETYYTVKAEDGTYSFHILDLAISAIGLKTSSNGMYYYANYQCDDTLKGAITSYGIDYALYDAAGTTKIVDKEQSVTISNSEVPLVTFVDIAIGSMNGVIGSNIESYTDSDCGQMKIEAIPFININGEKVTGTAVKYSMKDCCTAVDEMITALLTADAQDATAASYIAYMTNLFDVVWADYELGWNFTNFNKAT